MFPRLGGYVVVAERVVDKDGVEVVLFRKVSAQKADVMREQ